MKNQTFWKWALGASLAGLPLVGGCLQEPSNPAVSNVVIQHEALAPAAAVAGSIPVATNSPATSAASTNAAPAETLSDAALANAPVAMISEDKPLPPNLHPTAAVTEVIKLGESGVDEGVMLAYVTNSPGTFNLSADQIIYLKDIGVPGAVVTAMIEHDEAFKANAAQAAAAVAPSEPIPQPAPVPTGPPPAEFAPQPDYAAVAPEAAPPPPADVSYPVFYDSLAPYGNWVYAQGYGQVWQPSVTVINPTWQPYFDGGHWVYTDCGWYWYSDYSWGWAPFHYGRWFRHAHLGWCWAPDTVWGPAWVTWRYNDAYCGWAPLPPSACYVSGVGLTWYGSHVSVGFDFGLGVNCWAFVDFHHFHDHHLHHYAVPHNQRENVYHHTTVVNKIVVDKHNTIINEGIAPEKVSAITRTEVHKVRIQDSKAVARPYDRAEKLEGRTLTVYRPRLPQPATTSASAGSPNNRSELRRGNTSYSLPPTTVNRAGRSSTVETSSRSTPTVPQTQNRGQVEKVPPGSLVIIGKKDGARPAGTPTTSATPQANYRSAPAARNNVSRQQLAEDNSPAWLNTPEASRTQPNSRLETPKASPWSESRPVARPAPSTQVPRTWVAPGYEQTTPRAVQTPRANPAPSYSVPRAIETPRAVETPRPSAPAYTAPRSYSAPAYSAPRAVEVPRPSAPSYSAPASAPSYSAPRSAPSYSAPRSYSPPASSGGQSSSQRAAPSSNSGGGGGRRSQP